MVTEDRVDRAPTDPGTPGIAADTGSGERQEGALGGSSAWTHPGPGLGLPELSEGEFQLL